MTLAAQRMMAATLLVSVTTLSLPAQTGWQIGRDDERLKSWESISNYVVRDIVVIKPGPAALGEALLWQAGLLDGVRLIRLTEWVFEGSTTDAVTIRRIEIPITDDVRQAYEESRPHDANTRAANIMGAAVVWRIFDRAAGGRSSAFQLPARSGILPITVNQFARFPLELKVEGLTFALDGPR